MRHTRRAVTTLSLLLAAVVAWSAWPDSRANYVLWQAAFQLELLWGREPLPTGPDPRFNDAERLRLADVPAIQAYGARVGLAASDNYNVVNPAWRRTIWNVTACDPAALRPRTWWFPVVGRMPYLGFFRDRDAARHVLRLRAEGWDVYARTAGAYSTLGWFQDPLTPEMLRWSESQLAETLLHELTHATVWIPGSVDFNESLASFVGERAGIGYLEDRYGHDADIARVARDRLTDRVVFREGLHAAYLELDAMFARTDLSPRERLDRKAAFYADLPVRVARLPLRDRRPWVRWVRQGDWNNARMVQFRTYNRSPEHFQALLDDEAGDLAAFLRRVAEVTRGATDPYVAVAAAVGAPASEPPDAR